MMFKHTETKTQGHEGFFASSLFVPLCLCVFVHFFSNTRAGAQARPPARDPLTMAAPGGIQNSPHNLSASGPGAIRASTEQEVCIFCHTPHNASPIQPLWNRNMPVSAYTPYTSNSLQARPGQPTGTSKLCLSCHDGAIAVGSVLSRSQAISMAGGITTLPPGASNLGTDLSDDHPISFRYDDALVTRNPKLKPPGSLPQGIRLDKMGEMQCTSCHDAHDNSKGKFLVMDNTNSQLCNSCHNQGVTTIVEHNQCASCHQPHTAPSAPYLLKGTTVSETCNTCHSSAPSPTQGANIAADMTKISVHDTNPAVNLPAASNAVACNSCHEPHTMVRGVAPAPIVAPSLGKIDGETMAGAVVPVAQFTYEVCFKCHGEQDTVAPYITRQIVQTNKRLQFTPSAVSYHPVTAAGKNMDVPSLVPGLTVASLLYCVDCHGSDDSKAAGRTGPNGPHGSNVKPLLQLPYSTLDFTTESANSYALCYKCHERSLILNSPTFPQHNSHVVADQTPCSVCHDAHGVSSTQGNAMHNSKLINFDTTVVTPDPVTGKLEYDSLGPRAGQCFLSCHGVNHSPLAYPSAGPVVQQPIHPLRRGPALPRQQRFPPKAPKKTPQTF
jgi:predicted CXXCH cytochrome family protein